MESNPVPDQPQASDAAEQDFNDVEGPETSEKPSDEELRLELEDLDSMLFTARDILPSIRSREELVGAVEMSTCDVRTAVQQTLSTDWAQVYHRLRRLAASALYVASCVRNNENF